MIVDRRRIELLSLRAQHRADVRKGASTIEEALRLASMPGDGAPGRLYVRRLDLPAIRLRAGAVPIARWIGARLRELRGAAVPITDRRADRAHAVIVRDPIEPLYVALVQAGVRHRRLTEWFWPRVDPRLAADRSPARIVATLWQLLAERVDAAVVVPAVVGALLDVDREGGAFAAIEPAVARVLTRSIAAPTMPRARLVAAVESVIAPRWRPALRRVLVEHEHDVRATLLVHAAARATHPRLAPASVAALIEQAHVARELAENERVRDASAAMQHAAIAAEQHPANVDPCVQPPPPASVDAPRVLARGDAGDRQQATPEPTVASDASMHIEPSDRAAAAPSDPPTTLRWVLDERPQPTRFGGLYFLVRPLVRLGLGDLLARDPALERAELGVLVLARLADALEIPPDDPIRRPLSGEREAIGGIADVVAEWADAATTWIERFTELDVRTIVERSAALTCTRTHVDVIFDLNASDVRIRRAALDVDPGWVPWLSRVVQFHYVVGGMLDA